MYWFPPLPPLPVIVKLLRLAACPKLLIPAHVVVNMDHDINDWWGLPLRADVTLKGMLEMGMSPIVVLATTSAEPLNSNSTA